VSCRSLRSCVRPRPKHAREVAACERFRVILSGRAWVEIDGVEHEVAADDTTFLPANIPHRFRNASQTESLRIFWTYAAIDATRTIISTGQTRSIDDEHDPPAKA
jgi:putative monooxygenase